MLYLPAEYRTHSCSTSIATRVRRQEQQAQCLAFRFFVRGRARPGGLGSSALYISTGCFNEWTVHAHGYRRPTQQAEMGDEPEEALSRVFDNGVFMQMLFHPTKARAEFTG